MDRAMLNPFAVVLVCFLLFTPVYADNGQAWVWWEAEQPVETNFPQRTWFSPQNDAEAAMLSGGAWLTNEGNRQPGSDEAFAIYHVEVPADGQYNLWTRKFWKHGPFRWRFNDQPWQICGRDIALADGVSLRTHVGANWVHLGRVNLTQGAHRFEFRLLAEVGEALTSGFDAFLLIDGVFKPQGKLKPGERLGIADEGFFPWEPAADHFGDDALLDLRHLNEPIAGQHGPVRREGSRLVLGNGEPVRFWSVNISASNTGQDRQAIDYMARKLAKLGVNMVRYHSPMFDSEQVDRVDQQRLDDLFYTIAALKREGIYTKLSFYFPIWFELTPRTGVAGYEGWQQNKPFGIIFFDQRMQQVHRGWVDQILTKVNPYTGRTLAEEPALAMVELINEDSLFFWTFSKRNIPPAQWRTLEQRFGIWLIRRYGTLDAAYRAWGGARMREDDPRARTMTVQEAWHMTRDALNRMDQPRHRRMRDQVRFLASLQHQFYGELNDHIKNTIGYRGLIVASNWQAADPRVLDIVERYTYTAGDVIDRHGYFGGRHEGEGASYSIRVGHEYEDRSALRHPLDLPVQFNQIAGYPHIISEIGWPNPNRFRAEMTLLAGGYGSLQDVDGFCFFALGSNYVRDTAMGKFQLASPAIINTFPAHALMYRRGDITPGRPAMSTARTRDELFSLQPETFTAGQALDMLRQEDGGNTGETLDDNFTALGFYVGQVLRAIDQPAPDATGIARYIDPAGSTVQSNTGQIKLNHATGLLTINAPNVQAIGGFVGEAGRVTLENLQLESDNEYLVLTLISLDGKPIAESKRLLLQVVTEDKPRGFRAAAGKIESLGDYPFGIRKIEGMVRLKLSAPHAARVIALDENGYATDKPVEMELVNDRSMVQWHLRHDTCWYIIAFDE